MKVITNHNWRQFVYRCDVPKDVLESEFDWTNEGDHIDGFFCYRGVWYHLDDFMASSQLPGWDGLHTDSFFSGVAIKLSDDCEEYQIATVFS